MKQRGESQRSLAAALHVSHRAVGGWLEGAEPRGNVAVQLADHFKVPIEDLFDDAKDLPFDRYLSELRGAKEEVQAAYGGNPEAQQVAFDLLQEQKHRKRSADRLRKVIAELASIASDMDTSDERLHQIASELKAPRRDDAAAATKLAELKETVQTNAAAAKPERKHA